MRMMIQHSQGMFARHGMLRRFGSTCGSSDPQEGGDGEQGKGHRLAFGGYTVRSEVKALASYTDPDGFHDNIVRGARVKFNDSSALKLRRRAYIQWEPGHPSRVLIVKKTKNSAASAQLKDIADWLVAQGLQVYVERVVQATEFPQYLPFEPPTMAGLEAMTLAGECTLASPDTPFACGVPLPYRPNALTGSSSLDPYDEDTGYGLRTFGEDGDPDSDGASLAPNPPRIPQLSGAAAAAASAEANARAMAARAAPPPSPPLGLPPLPRRLRQGSDVDFCITLGGDGTVLHLASLFERDEPLPPVISFAMGTLGFLTPFDVSEYRLRLTRVMAAVMGDKGAPGGGANPLFCTLRTRKRCEVYHAGKLQCVHNVLNEMVIDRGASPSVAVLELFIDGNFVTMVEADGLIIASPSGSTAYSMSAGGPIIAPSVPCTILTPIAPLSLSFRPLVIPESSSILIHLPDSTRHARASFDGKKPMRMRRDSCILVTTSLCPLPVINMGAMDSDWYDGVNKKLKWNQAMRTPAPKLPAGAAGASLSVDGGDNGWFNE